MKNLIVLLVAVLTSCSCGLTLSNKKSVAADTAVVSTTGVQFETLEGWERLPNFMRIPLPGPSFEDITLVNKETEVMLFISSVAVEDNLDELLDGLNNANPDALKSNIVDSADIAGAREVSIKVKNTEYRVVAISDKKFTHLFQATITKPAGGQKLSELLKTVKLQ